MQIKRFVNLVPHIVFVPICILTIFVAVNTYTKSLPVEEYLARLDVLPPVVSSFTFIICFVCKVMPYLTSTVLFICLFRAR